MAFQIVNSTESQLLDLCIDKSFASPRVAFQKITFVELMGCDMYGYL